MASLHNASLEGLRDITTLEAEVTSISPTMMSYQQLVPGRYLLALFVLFMSSLDVLCNVLVIVVYVYTRALNRLSNYRLVIGLSSCDIMLALTVLIHVYPVWTGHWPFGEVACALCINIGFSSLASSIVIILIISLDRYFAVAHPFVYSRLINPRRLLMSMLLVFVLLFGQMVAGTVWNLTRQKVVFYPWCGIYSSNYPSIHVPVMNVVVGGSTILVVASSVRVICIARATARIITDTQRRGSAISNMSKLSANAPPSDTEVAFLNSRQNSMTSINNVTAQNEALSTGNVVYERNNSLVAPNDKSSAMDLRKKSSTGKLPGNRICRDSVTVFDEDEVFASNPRESLTPLSIKALNGQKSSDNTEVTQGTAVKGGKDPITSNFVNGIKRAFRRPPPIMCMLNRRQSRQNVESVDSTPATPCTPNTLQIPGILVPDSGQSDDESYTCNSMQEPPCFGNEGPPPQEGKRHASDRRAAMVLLTLIISFIISFVPSVILVTFTNPKMLHPFQVDAELAGTGVLTLSFIFTVIVPLNGILNVFVYCLFNRKFRRGLRRLFGRMPGMRHASEVDLVDERMESVGFTHVSSRRSRRGSSTRSRRSSSTRRQSNFIEIRIDVMYEKK